MRSGQSEPDKSAPPAESTHRRQPPATCPERHSGAKHPAAWIPDRVSALFSHFREFVGSTSGLRRQAEHYETSASRQYLMDRASSVIRSELAGILYSNSIVAWMFHLFSRNRRSTS